MSALVPVILCGGSGTRLWPRSRATKPKPFLNLIGECTLFEQALSRCPQDLGFAPPVVVTGLNHLDHVEVQSASIPGLQILVEPMPRNTAAAIALAACRLPDDAVMLVCPSDHHIGDAAAFREAAHAAAELARQGWLVSFGIHAATPETGFGYIKRGEAIGARGFKTEKFIEKPELARAQEFIADGGYAWNGGIFAFQVGKFREELSAYRPAIATAVAKAVAQGKEEGARFTPDAELFASVESDSVDYAVMENTGSAAMIPVDMNWSDIGNWAALLEALDRDECGNVSRGSGDVELVDCKRVMVDNDGLRVSIIGLEDVIVVVDGKDVMITAAAGVQKVGKLAGAVNQ